MASLLVVNNWFCAQTVRQTYLLVMSGPHKIPRRGGPAFWNCYRLSGEPRIPHRLLTKVFWIIMNHVPCRTLIQNLPVVVLASLRWRRVNEFLQYVLASFYIY